MNLYRSTRRPI